MTEKKEIKVNTRKVMIYVKLLILSSVLSFCLLLIIAHFGAINSSHQQAKYSSDMCYYGILCKDGYCNLGNDGSGESIQIYYGYTNDSPDIPTDKQTWYQPLENERWSIPKTFFTKARKDSDITFIDKLLVIYIPLILAKNVWLWIFVSILLFFAIRLKNKYQLKFE